MNDVQTIVIDLAEQLFNDIKYAHYGRTGTKVRAMPSGKKYKDTSEAEQEFVDLINGLATKHLILTHRRKEIYEKDQATGRFSWSGYKWLGHNCNLIIEHVNNRRYDPTSEDENKNWHYGVNIIKCLHKPELEGPDGKLCLKDEFVTFEMLAAMVLPN